MGTSLDAIDAAVAAVGDPADGAFHHAAVAAALRSVSPAQVDAVVLGTDDPVPPAAAEVLVTGFGVSPGAGTGRVCTTSDEALDLAAAGAEVVLWVDHTGPADEPAVRVAAAVVTAGGGPASHAAIVARQWGVPAVCAVGALPPPAGEVVTVDGAAGTVRRSPGGGPAARGRAGLTSLPAALEVLLGWADGVVDGRVRVVANAERPVEVRRALALGAAGVGLCRTEHLLTGDRLPLVRPVLEGTAGPADLERLVEAQTADLVELLDATGGRPVKVRLLDAPLQEFLPGRTGTDPVLGLRGARLALVRPGLVEAQATALARAVVATGHDAVSVTVPMVALAGELTEVADRCRAAVAAVDPQLDLPVGVMVETPRAALVAETLAPHAAHLSFGTNDLTQLALGVSRDDLDAELHAAHGRLLDDPFTVLDAEGVGVLVAVAVAGARQVRPDLVASACGEQAADPRSAAFLVAVGVDELSVAPARVPAVRLAVAHAFLGEVR